MYKLGQVLRIIGGYHASEMFAIVVSDNKDFLVTEMPGVAGKRVWDKRSYEWRIVHSKRISEVAGTWDYYKHKAITYTTDKEKTDYYKKHI